MDLKSGLTSCVILGGKDRVGRERRLDPFRYERCFLHDEGRAFGGGYAPHLERRLRAIAFITVGELYYGADNANWGKPRRKKLETILRNFVVVLYDHEVARCYGRIVSEQRKTIAPNDAWIAACAVRHGVPLVPHDADFGKIPSLKIITEQVD